MRYLAKYRLFLEEIEGENLGEIPPFDPEPAEWIDKIDKSAEEEKEVSGDTKETQSSSESENVDTKDSDKTKTKSSEKNSSTESIKNILGQIFSSINSSYKESSTGYFFRPYAFKLIDNIHKAVEDFFGENQFDKNSWWYSNVTEKISKHITITIDGQNYGLIQAMEKGKDLKFIQSAIDSQNSKNENFQMIGIKLLTEVWPGLREATINSRNNYRWIDSTGETNYEIDVDADFGVGKQPSNTLNETEYISSNKEEWKKKIDKVVDDAEKLNPLEIFGLLKTIVLYIDGLFQDGSKNVWKSYKGRINDDDTGAATWLEAQRTYMKKYIFEPLKTKVDGCNYANPLAKDYYKKQIDRIDRELLGKIIEKMRSNFDLYDTVEFRLQDFSKNVKVDIEIDTDF
jgi:hypothetical protein